MKQPADRLQHLDVLRGFAILLVVAGHAYGYTVGKTLPEHPALWESLLQTIAGMAVPAFFMVDGILTARSFDRKGKPSLSDVARKGARRLLIPWVIFNILYVGLRILFEWKGLASENLILHQSAREIFNNIFYTRVSMQLYFLPSLFLIRIAATLLWPILRGGLPVTIAVWLGYRAFVTFAEVSLEGDFISNAIVGFNHFLLGMVVGRVDQPEKRWATPILALASILAIAQTRLNWPDSGHHVSDIIHQAGLTVSCYLLAKPISRIWTPLTWLGSHTMEIYLLHGAALMKVIQVVVNKFTTNTAASTAAITIIDVIASATIAIALSRFRWSNILFGKSN